MPRRLHLRGQPDALHPPGRVRGLRGVRARLSGRGDLLRGRPAGEVEGLLPGERRLLRRPRFARWGIQGGEDREGSPADPGAATAVRRRALTGGADPAFWADRLPTFPWDLLGAHARRAAEHVDGMVDLSIGTPVDPVPDAVRRALAAGADTPGYPATAGTVAVREAAVRWLTGRLGVRGIEPDAVLPTVGSKELISLLPFLFGAQPG